MSDHDVVGIRAGLDHPIVDVDGHIVESIAVVVDYMRRVAGDDVADRCGAAAAPGIVIPPWWAVASNALDRATAFLPNLLHERLDEIGLDFTILYSSVGLVCFAHPDDEIRRG